MGVFEPPDVLDTGGEPAICAIDTSQRRRNGEWPDMLHGSMPLQVCKVPIPLVLPLEFHVVIVGRLPKYQVQIKVVLHSHEISNIGTHVVLPKKISTIFKAATSLIMFNFRWSCVCPAILVL
jgi:hypothetical protein